ncbi:MAG TPA: M90 family metallopeptidase [Kofleriaceae bacterium]
MFGWLTERRRKHLLETPFPDAWLKILDDEVAAYGLLTEDEQKHLRDLAQVFIAEKNWEGCGGLELVDEMKVVIAGEACQMLLGRDHDLFAGVVSILVYPSTVVIPPQEVGVFTFPTAAVSATPILGEATRAGTVILAWDTVKANAQTADDGRNVVIHELAHQIDMLDGSADGTPPLDPAEARRWGQAFEAAFVAQKTRAEHHQKSLLRDYAITNEAEYFAVVSEVFFEKPVKLQHALPDVYASLAAYYGLDLAARSRNK